MKDLTQLASFLNKLDSKIRNQASLHAKMIAGNVHEELVYETPVDTSRALSNWQVSLGSPISGEIPPYALGFQGTSADVSASAAIASGQRAIANKIPGQSIFITNNVSYIIDLNNGSSIQAPSGFIEDSVMIGVMKTPMFKLKV